MLWSGLNHVSPNNTCPDRTIPANPRRSPNVGTMLGQRRRRWANIVPTLGEHLVFAGIDKPLTGAPGVLGRLICPVTFVPPSHLSWLWSHSSTHDEQGDNMAVRGEPTISVPMFTAVIRRSHWSGAMSVVSLGCAFVFYYCK